MTPGEMLRIGAQDIANLVEGIGVGIVAVGVAGASYRYVVALVTCL